MDPDWCRNNDYYLNHNNFIFHNSFGERFLQYVY